MELYCDAYLAAATFTFTAVSLDGSYGGGRRSGRLSVDGRRCPIPRKQLLQPGNKRVSDAARTSASHACGSMLLSFAVMISVAMQAARSAPLGLKPGLQIVDER